MQSAFDPSKNFGSSAKGYAAFRPEYPPEVFEFLLQHMQSDRLHAVDLGAGSGQATKRLATLFDRVTAVEPDARMADGARLPSNAAMEIKLAEEADFAEASIDAVISATAFHWMDQPLLCRKVSRWLKPGGVFFPFAFDALEVEGAAKSFFAAEFAKWASYRDRRIIECYDYGKALQNSGAFKTVIAYRQSLRHELPSAMAAGLVSTFSFAREYAREQGGDDYFDGFKRALADFGDTVIFIAPIVGALGTKT